MYNLVCVLIYAHAPVVSSAERTFVMKHFPVSVVSRISLGLPLSLKEASLVTH